MDGGFQHEQDRQWRVLGCPANDDGPNAFSASVPFDPSKVQRSTVGDATLTFSDANNGTFRYTVNGITQTKNITRLVFAAGPVTVCK